MPSDKPVFRLKVFPADHGDCLWIEHGTNNDLHHVLIDAGTDRTGKRLLKYIVDQHHGKVHFDLFVVTHIDADHIGGALPLLANAGVTFGDIWFNGYVHLKPDAVDAFGGVQGEKLTTLLLKRKNQAWNGAFQNKAVRLTHDGKNQKAQLKTGASLVVVSADEGQLVRVEKNWKEDCRKAGLDPKHRRPRENVPPGFERMGIPDVDALAESTFTEDTAPPNGSSIGLVFEFEKKCLVLLGDAYPSVVLKGLRALQPTGRFKADVVKLAHHGSRVNTSRELVERIDGESWDSSTSGAHFRHPDTVAVARLIVSATQPRLYFNYPTNVNASL